jgi:superfamily I DNA and RNA helicase
MLMQAQRQAEKIAEEGKTVLFLCYNKIFVKCINDLITDEYKNLITVKNFHGLCADWGRKSGISFSPPDNRINTFWQHEAADLLIDAIDIVPDKFDDVIVVEGQDFYPNWWIPLKMLNSARDKEAIYIYYDPR